MAQSRVRQTWEWGHACRVTSGKSLPTLGTGLPVRGLEGWMSSVCTLELPMFTAGSGGGAPGPWSAPLEQFCWTPRGLGHLEDSDGSRIYCLKNKFGQCWAFSALLALTFCVA